LSRDIVNIFNAAELKNSDSYVFNAEYSNFVQIYQLVEPNINSGWIYKRELNHFQIEVITRSDSRSNNSNTRYIPSHLFHLPFPSYLSS
jgi:hypothetical protein